jgi:hypothetical protein
LLLIVVITAFAGGVWALARFKLKRLPAAESSTTPSTRASDPDLWAHSMEKLKEVRLDAGNVAIEIPDQLRHYDDRRWFLATQVAEVKKFNLQPVQDFVDLAALMRRGEMVPLPAVTETYILFGVGARVDGDAFTRYVADQNLGLTDEAGLRDAYARLETEHAKLQKEISDLQAPSQSQSQSHLASPKNRAVTEPSAVAPGAGVHSRADSQPEELETEIRARQQELRSNDEDKALLNRYYGQASASSEGGQTLYRDYDSLQALAKNFGGRSFNLDDASDRQTLKVYLLSSLRPPALKVLEEIAKHYHDKFARPLPVSSLIRPEQYQRALRRVNRYAVVIDTPPHSTGLAFDIDYRYLSNTEQNFVMSELARMKDEGRIEVIRERGANYHVFVFLDGQRPSDDLITASLDEVGPAPKQTNNDDDEKDQSQQTPARVESKSRTAKKTRPTAKAKRTTSKTKPKKRR